MYPEIAATDGNIELVQNSGIQFVDYDVLIDWKDRDPQSTIRTLENGFFVRVAADKEEPLIRLVPKVSGDVHYVDPLFNRRVEVENATYVVSLKQSLELYDGVWFPVPFLPEHVQYSVNSDGNQVGPQGLGPINWVRARIIKVDDPAAITAYQVAHGQKVLVNAAARAYMDVPQEKLNAQEEVITPNAMRSVDTQTGLSKSECYYRIVFAFDTKTQDFDAGNGYFAPTTRDIESGVRFKLAYTADRCQGFLKGQGSALPWVREWAAAVFKDLYIERIKPKMLEEDMLSLLNQDHMHEAHYLNVLAFLGFMIEPRPVHFIANQLANLSISSKIIDVSLILDIGNSRSCGIMVEDHPNVTRGDDDFSDTYVLTLRDLNAPEQVYNEPFASRIEFAKPNFDYDNRSARSGRPDAFSWPSMVRIGTEASNLASHREGNEGLTGLISPKRYLWNTERLANDRWIFNSYSYLINSKKLANQQKEQVQRAFLNNVGTFFNTDGKAYFALDADENTFDNLESRYSNRSTMTFMLIELILQAMTQMNSVAQREQCTSKDTPRRLKAIILTTPPSMPAEEKELYRACVYEALGILWKSLGFDRSAPNEFNFGRDSTDICPPIPEVHMDWNEAEAGQVVYIYNESQKTFKGDCKAFIASLRRPLMQKERLGERLTDGEGNKLLSTRIASIDIGGGTTDLVIKDYSFKQSEASFASDIVPHEVLKDGFKIAGDDVVHDLIRECIVTRLAYTLAKHKINFKPVLQQLVGEVNSGNVRNEVLRAQFTQQILVKIAYKILFHLEHLDPYAYSTMVKGTVRDFILDREVNPSLPLTVNRLGPSELPSDEVISFVDNIMGQYLRGFSIMDFKLSFDIAKINRAMLEGNRFNLCRVLSKLGEVLSTFEVDLLLLTGRASKLPAVRSFFNQRLSIPSARILPMHRYRCESWYPFKHDGEFIGDPKTTAAVGALLCYLRLSHDKFPNFRFYSYPEEVTNNAHYVGIIDNSNMISDDAVLYKYESSRMVAKINATDEDDEESNFVPYKREDESFKTQLAVELGYRLLDDPNFEATPLYKIEAFNSVDEIKQVKKALVLNYSDLSRESVCDLVEKIDFEIQAEYQAKSATLLDRIERLRTFPIEQLVVSEPDLDGKKGELESNLLRSATAHVEATYVEPSGVKSLFASKQKIQEEKQALVNRAYQEQYEAQVLEPLKGQAQDMANTIEEQLAELLNAAIEHNINLLRQRYIRGYESLRRKLDIERVQFNVTLKKVNRHSPYPLSFIRKNLPYLKPVESFELESVTTNDGMDYTAYFKMYLKTISGAKVKYFMDSGAIDLNGINPRLVL